GSRIEDVKLSASDLELNRVDPRVRGTAKLDLTASGPKAKPSFDGRFDFAGIGYEKADFGDATVTLQGTAAASQWTLGAPALSLNGNGDLTTGKAPALTGILTADRTPLATFAPLAPGALGLEGTASATADIRVPLEAPAKAEFTARFTILEARTARFGPIQTQPFSIRYGANRGELRDFRAEGPGVRAWIDGDFGLGGSSTVSGKARLDVDLAGVEPRLEGVAGRIGADVNFDGVAERPIVTGAVNLTDVAVDRPNRPRLRVADGVIRIENNVAVADNLKAELDGGVLVLAGRVPVPALVARWRADPKRVAPDEAADVALRWDGFDAGVLLARLRPTAENRLAARLTGSLTLRGGLLGLGEIDALLASQAADVAAGEVNGRLEGFEVRVAQGRASTEGIQIDAAGGTFRLSGAAGIASKELDVTGRGTLDLRVLSPLLADTALTGTADIDARVTGTTTAPEAHGSLTVTDGTARFRGLTQALTDIQADVVLARSQVRLERASAFLGGGNLTASGTVALSGRSVGAVDVAIKGQDMALRYPEGLRSRIEADLKLTGQPGSLLLAGDLRASRALYDRDFQTSAFLAAVTVEDSPLLRSIALDLNLISGSPLRVRNDTARLEATGQLSIRGDMQSPSPFGRFEVIAPGGELILLGARYAINRGTITYTGSWDPEIDMGIQRRIRVRQSTEDVTTVPGDYTATIATKGTVSEITREVFQLALGGRPDDRTDTLRFSAEGPGDLDPNDVGYLALIGRRRSDVRGARLAGEQTGTLVASQLARKIQRGLPFENITIQPELVSRETAEPDARFTFGASLTDGVDLTYSLSLSTPEDKLIQLEGRTVKNFTAIVKREHDLDERSDLITVGGGQRFEFGGVRARRLSRSSRNESVALTEVAVQGIAEPALEKQAKEAIKAELGKNATPWTVQDDGDRIRETLLKRGYIDVEVGADLEGTVATFDVRTGRPYVTRINGMSDPPDLAEVLRKSLYEEEAFEMGRTRILEELFEKGHWRGKVETTAKDEGQTRVLAFDVEPGPVLKLGTVTFPGARALTRDQLLAAAGGPGPLLSAPQEARTAIRKEYEKIHHLRAGVLAPNVVEESGKIDIEVEVEEGQRSFITQVVFEGSSRPEAELLALSRLRPGMPYDEEEALLSVDAIRNDYHRNGW
ncbi:MAG TPA: translocation/assembly module TamB domain-containing protein, partial [Planctomycetota bacterium]|nr:translocation/assembly module TamB domain-containing protein [Planctomycetota bacterium]